MNPRALNGRLSEFVIGQAKAKRVLSVAVYNHFNRVRAILVPKLDQDLLPHPFNVFQPATSSSPPRKRSIPPVAALGSDIIRLTDQPLPGLLQSKGTESDLSAQPDWIQDQVTPLRRKRTNTPILDPDPTTYDQLEITPRKRTIKASATFQSEILTDFPGQSQAFPPLQSTTSSTSPIGSMRRPTINDPNDIQEKSNVLLIGPTGSGKTLLARTLAQYLDVPFVACEATGLTMAGYVGEDVESCVQRLLVAADWDVDRAATGIIFIDEIDKLARSASASHSKDVSGEGVQQALLKILEGTVVNISDKEGAGARGRKGIPKETYQVDTTNILFILSGAFVGLEKIIASRLKKRQSTIGFTAAPSPPSIAAIKSLYSTTPPDPLDNIQPSDISSFGFLQEFVGRLPVVVTLTSLTASDLLRILTEPRNALVKQYQALFKRSGVELRFTNLALKVIADRAVVQGSGARGLRRAMEDILLDSMFEVPESSVMYVLIDKKVVEKKKSALYFARGQQHLFHNAFDAEQKLDTTVSTSSMTIGDGRSEVDELEADVRVRREEREERQRATG